MTQTIFAGRSAAVAVLVGLFILVNIAPSQAADPSMHIKNETGVTMVQFYARNASEDGWNEDILGDGDLLSGGRTEFYYEGGGYCIYAFRAVFANGDELRDNGVNVCENTSITYGSK